jgi:protoporphyrinogen oxidase
MMAQPQAIIIGAGPAGLTAAYELLHKTDIKPIVYEQSRDVGGISKTVNYKGNRIDIGGHRFFSKSDRVMQWWQNIMPLEEPRLRADAAPAEACPHDPVQRPGDSSDPKPSDNVMLVRNRLSRIFFRRRFFDYPVSLNLNTVLNLGLARVARIGMSYMRARLLPIKEEKSLEDFLINRFGRELYATFFRDYTEKVWGVPCRRIRPEWGAQRIKGLSITKALTHAARRFLRQEEASIGQKNTETSLIDRFLYPKFGPGHLWQEVARIVRAKGGEIHLGVRVTGVRRRNNRLVAIDTTDQSTQQTRSQAGDYFFSTMPVKELIQAMVGGHRGRKTVNNIVPDNWIYIQEPEVRVGRLQIFNNWSPYMVKDPATVWLGLEYFCNVGDELWSKSDVEFARFAIDELASIGIIDQQDVLDSVVIRMPNTYPAYFGTYDRFDVIREFVDEIDNLFLIGRNGMHRYNNQDHSMLAAMTAVENIIGQVKSKDNIWNVNVEQEYHEEQKQVAAP